MRLSAYKKLIDTALTLPDTIDKEGYFKKPIYSPRREAIVAIMNEARLDVQGLFLGELIRLKEYLKSKGY